MAGLQRPAFTPQEVRRIVFLHTTHKLTRKQIAIRFGTNAERIAVVLRQAGVTSRNPWA